MPAQRARSPSSTPSVSPHGPSRYANTSAFRSCAARARARKSPEYGGSINASPSVALPPHTSEALSAGRLGRLSAENLSRRSTQSCDPPAGGGGVAGAPTEGPAAGGLPAGGPAFFTTYAPCTQPSWLPARTL